MNRVLSSVLLSCALAGAASAQSRAPQESPHAHHAGHHKVATQAKLEVGSFRAGNMVTLRVGPLDLPANSDHMGVAQPADMYWEVPFDGWLTAYHPAVVNANGDSIPGKLLHHVAFWNTSRSDFLCPNKEEHIFGAGGEMNDWPEIPGFGYRVARGDRLRINSMWHNPTAQGYTAYLDVHVEFQRAGEGAPRKSVYPTWFDVKECGNSGYDLAPGPSVTTGEFTLGYTGTLLGVGGHLHDYGLGLVLENAARNERIARLDSQLDANGLIQSMPVLTFTDRGGYRLNHGEKIRVTATYDNRTGKPLPDGAMGIVVGYFLPDNDAQMAALRRKPRDTKAAAGHSH
jgi:hypothetical protein